MDPEVVLINANGIRPLVAPLALDYLAAALEEQGFGVRLLDLALEGATGDNAAAAVARCFSRTEPCLVGITFRNTDDCYYASQASFLPGLKELVALVRANTGAPVVLGGCGFSLMPEAILGYVGSELGVKGEGEVALPLLAAAAARGLPAGELASIPGLLWRQGNLWRRNPSQPLNLGQSGFLAQRSAVDVRRYFQAGGQGNLETKRGCDRHCIFCADPVSKGRVVRLRPPQEVAYELAGLVARGVDCIHLCDSEFNVPYHHALEVCNAIQAAGMATRCRWYAYASPEPFSRELLVSMQRAGCVGINFGVDSGSDLVLRRLGRTFRAADLRQVAGWCREAGMTFMFDLLLGGPGETRATVRETFSLVQELGPDRVGISVGVRVYPGTPLARMLGRGEAECLHPVFYLAPGVEDEIEGWVMELVGDDPRFFFASREQAARNYNYNDNRVLVEAVALGYRGAYWDILRKLAEGLPPP